MDKSGFGISMLAYKGAYNRQWQCPALHVDMRSVDNSRAQLCNNLVNITYAFTLILHLIIDLENDWIANSPSHPLCDVVYVASRMREIINAWLTSGKQTSQTQSQVKLDIDKFSSTTNLVLVRIEQYLNTHLSCHDKYHDNFTFPDAMHYNVAI